MTVRTALRRTTYLLVGGAIALGFLGLTAAVVSVFVNDADQLVAFLCLAAVPAAAVGLLPGIRELEVAGVRTLLGVDRAVVPEPMGWAHRWRTCLWTFLHQAMGFLTGLALMLASSAVIGVTLLATSTRSSVFGGYLTRPDYVGAWLRLWAVALGSVGAAVAFVWLVGAAAFWAAPILLGPIGTDRLAIAEAKLRREQGYRRLSRDLHDGVGHALSAISLQAEAGRRHIETAPDRTEAALSAIRALAGSAVGELDHALSVLRDDAAPRHPEPGLAQLDVLVEAHRSQGAAIAVEQGDLGDLPAIISTTAYRVCAEGLTNAAKHGTGPVTLMIARDDRQVRVELRNHLRHPARSGAGHGLDGLRERVEMLGGNLTAGPDITGWVLNARLPLSGPT